MLDLKLQTGKYRWKHLPPSQYLGSDIEETDQTYTYTRDGKEHEGRILHVTAYYGTGVATFELEEDRWRGFESRGSRIEVMGQFEPAEGSHES